jgi:hypothetical protein
MAVAGLQPDRDHDTWDWSTPLHVYPNIHASGRIPAGWSPMRGATLKFPIRNRMLLRYLRTLLSGRWSKGTTGEVHYFEHESGQVAGVKFF